MDSVSPPIPQASVNTERPDRRRRAPGRTAAGFTQECPGQFIDRCSKKNFFHSSAWRLHPAPAGSARAPAIGRDPWFRTHTSDPPRETLNVYGASDYAVCAMTGSPARTRAALFGSNDWPSDMPWKSRAKAPEFILIVRDRSFAHNGLVGGSNRSFPVSGE